MEENFKENDDLENESQEENINEVKNDVKEDDNHQETLEDEKDVVIDNEINETTKFYIEKEQKLTKKLKKSKILNVVLGIIVSLFVLVSILIASLVYIIFNKYGKYIYDIPTITTKEEKKEEVAVKTATESETNKLGFDKILKKLTSIDEITDAMFYYDKDTKNIENNIFTGYMKGLKDKYAEYMPPVTFENFITESKGEYYGIGCLVTQDVNNMKIVVSTVYEDSPAEKGGVKVDDEFIAVNQTPVQGEDINKVVELIKGEEGTDVTITVFRPSENKTLDLVCKRGKVEIKLVNSKIVDDNIGLITVTSFTGKADQQFKKAVDDLISKNAKGLIVDLRNNPGGELSVVLNMLDVILKNNDGKFTLNTKDFTSGRTLLVYMKDKKEVCESYYANDANSIEVPIVVLINGGSASASELFTRALVDYDKAKTVGEKSYGKGVVQNMLELEDGSAIKFTVSEYFSPSGYSINEFGIIPDYPVDVDGNKINYDKKGNIIEEDEHLATLSDAIFINEGANVTFNNVIIENNKHDTYVSDKFDKTKDISDEDNSFIEEDWYNDLSAEINDMQLMQAIMLIKENK